MAALKNNFVYQFLIASTQVAMPLITWPHITRVLGPDKLGTVNYVDFVAQIFMTIAAFGIPFYGIREIALVRNNPAKRGLLIKELIVLQSIFAIVSAGMYVLLTYKNWAQQPLLYLLGLCNILSISFSYDWYIQGMEHFKFAAIRAVFTRLLMIICFYMLVKIPGDYEVYYGIFTFGMMLTALLNAAKMWKENNFTASGIQLTKHLAPLCHFFITSSAITLYVNFDVIILQQLTHDATIVGYYSTAIKMVKVFLAVIITLSVVLVARQSFLAGEGKHTEMQANINKYLQFILVMGLPVCAGLFLLAPEIILLIAGDKFLPAVPLMRTLSFLPIIIALSNIFCFQVLVPYKQEKKFLVAAIIGCITSLLSNFLLIPVLSAQGAAWSSVITEITITVLTGCMAYKAAKIIVDKTALLQTMAATLLFVPVVLFCRHLSQSPIYVLLMAIAFCATIYFGLQYYLFKNQFVLELKTLINKMFKQSN